MNKIIKIILYCISIITCGYLLLAGSIFIFLQLQGVMLAFIYDEGLTELTITEVTIIPQILNFCFVLCCSIYLIINGFKWVKNEDNRKQKQ